MPRSLAKALSLVAWLIGLILAVFNLRRLVFLVVAGFDLVASRQQAVGDGEAGTAAATGSTPPVLVLVPVRDEAGSLPRLLDSLLAIEYPRSSLTIGLIDDGSTDGTGALVDGYARTHGHVQGLHNASSRGKAAALNAGLAHWRQGEIVAVYDADARPRPDSLGQIVAAFADPQVAAAGGLIRPANALATPVATYSALERLVHQQVTVRAKDRLALAPAILGSNCAYRRGDLAAAGGFPDGAFLEDSHLTVRLATQGRRIRFLPQAVALDQVPQTLSAFWRQRVRWSRGFLDVAAAHAGGETPVQGQALPSRDKGDRPGTIAAGPLLRLELWLFALGYLDRLALLAGLIVAITGRLAGIQTASMRLLATVMAVNLLLPYGQIAVALMAERAGPRWWLRLPLVPLLYVLDMASAAWSAILTVVGKPRVWHQAERAPT